MMCETKPREFIASATRLQNLKIPTLILRIPGVGLIQTCKLDHDAIFNDEVNYLLAVYQLVFYYVKKPCGVRMPLLQIQE